MGWLSDAFKGAIDYFIKGPYLWLTEQLFDQVTKLFTPDLPQVPAGLKSQGKAYNADLKQNLPRLGDVRTVGYGRWTDWYDLKCAYTEYENNEQLYKAYLHVTVGHAEVLALRIGNSPLTSFPGQRSEVLLPGVEMTLVHPNVHTSPDVQGIELRAGTSGQVRLTGAFDFAPSTGPGADPFRIRLIGSDQLTAVPNGSLVITDAGPNSGTYLVTSQGTAMDGFTPYSWVVVTSGMAEGTFNATMAFGVTDNDASTVKATGLALTMNNILSTLSAGDEDLADFQFGDVVELRDTADNDGIEFTVAAAGDGAELTVAPPPTYEVASSASVVLVRRRAGPFAACLPGDVVDRFGIDVVFDALSNSGGARAVTFEVRWRTIDDVGNPTGDWSAEFFTCSGKDYKPQRFSHYEDVSPPARVQVDLLRLTPESNSAAIRDDVQWSGLRGYVVAKEGETPRIDPTSTCIAVVVRSSGRLSRAQERTINGDNQRLLPVWDGETWSALQATRSPAWAITDWLKEQSNNLLSDAQLDLPSYLGFATGCTARGDTFDGAYDREVMLWEGAQTIARVARAKNYLDKTSGKISVVRDEPAEPSLLFADGINCQLGPTSFGTRNSDTPTGVRVKYIDPSTWTERADGVVAGSDEDPREVSFMGCIDREKAWAEAFYEWADLRYRVITFSGDAEMDGLQARVRRRVLVGSAVKGWGHVAEVTAADGLLLTLSLPQDTSVNWVEGAQHYVHLQGEDGLPTARINCTRVSLMVIELAVDPGITLRTGSSWQTIALIGHDGTEEVPASGPRVAIVEFMKPRGLREGSLQFRLDDARVHADPGPAPADPYETSGEMPDLTITGFSAERVGDRVLAEWDLLGEVLGYEVEQELLAGGWARKYFGGGIDPTWLTDEALDGEALRVRAYSESGTGPWTLGTAGPPTGEGMVTEDGSEAFITEDGEFSVLEPP